MKILLLAVGKVRSAPLAELCADYLARLQRFGPADVKEVKAAARDIPRDACEEECRRLEELLESSDRVMVLDERGAQVTSVELAGWLSQAERESVKRMVFVLGGAYGMTEALKARGRKLALSKLTLPHELCRAVALEQLYRARTIQNNLPYHHA
jgi:23S rRNA (pseudouridine1915-N3)-methyltransferase